MIVGNDCNIRTVGCTDAHESGSYAILSCNNARQDDAIEGASTANADDANLGGFDIFEMHEIGADKGANDAD